MSRKGIYVEMAHHPQAILDTMAGMEGAVARANLLQQLLQYLPIALTIIGIGGFLVLFFTSSNLPENLAFLFFVFFGIAAAGFVVRSATASLRSPLLSEHFDAARQVLHTLRDDTGRKGRVVGWLDLSGSTKEQKKVRTARSGGGKRKVYYRDPWFKVKFKLVDGNVLRLTLEDKVKTKAGSIVRYESQFSAKLVVNPDLYRLGEVPNSRRLAASNEFTHEDGVFVVKAAPRPAEHLSMRQVLETLKAVYSHLEPIEPEPAISA